MPAAPSRSYHTSTARYDVRSQSAALRAGHAGLSSVEAATRLARDGANLLPRRRPTPLWHRVAMQLRDPLVVVLLVAAALTILTGDWADADTADANTKAGPGRDRYSATC